MATVEKWVPASVEDLWAVVADARGYAFWVVGSHDIRDADDDWPAPGTKFHHTQGHGPIKVQDNTKVLESEPPHRLLLEVRIRPFGIGHVELVFRPDGDGTCVTMTETMDGGLAGLIPNPLIAPFMKMRNADALRRLSAMAWTRAQMVDEGSGTTPRSSARPKKARA